MNAKISHEKDRLKYCKEDKAPNLFGSDLKLCEGGALIDNGISLYLNVDYLTD